MRLAGQVLGRVAWKRGGANHALLPIDGTRVAAASSGGNR